MPLLNLFLLIREMEKQIGSSVKVTFSDYGGEAIPPGLKITAEWIIERRIIRLEHIIPASELDEARYPIDMETRQISFFIDKAKAGYLKKLNEIRVSIEKEIRDGTKAKEHQDRQSG